MLRKEILLPSNDKPKFELQFIAPYSTFEDGEPKPIPYVIDGLLPQGGFSILAGNPKDGKSSLSRIESVSVASGADFLGRRVEQGEVILISLEDPRNHTDNCLKVLGYDPSTHAPIHIVERLAPTVNETLEALGDALTKMPNVRLVVVDTLAKLLRVKDLSDYMPVLGAVEGLHDLARHFPQLNIQGLVHCKKVQSDNVFDGILGSTALRGETDTNIAIFQCSGERVITTETRIGRNIPPTILLAELVEFAGANVVKSFSLGGRFDELTAKKSAKREVKRTESYEERVIDYLEGCNDHTAPQETLLRRVGGNRQNVLDAVKDMVDGGALIRLGVPHSSANPLTLTLNVEALQMHRFMRLGAHLPEPPMPASEAQPGITRQ
jgi:hypothetical protein